MIAELKLNNNGAYYCSNCRMLSTLDTARCSFCGAIFSNYEEIQKALWDIAFKELVEDVNKKNDT